MVTFSNVTMGNIIGAESYPIGFNASASGAAYLLFWIGPGLKTITAPLNSGTTSIATTGYFLDDMQSSWQTTQYGLLDFPSGFGPFGVSSSIHIPHFLDSPEGYHGYESLNSYDELGGTEMWLNKNWTFRSWIKWYPSLQPSTHATLICFQDPFSTTTPVLELWANGSTNTIYVEGPILQAPISYDYSANSNLNVDGLWNHFSITGDTNHVRLYIGNDEVGNTEINKSLTIGTPSAVYPYLNGRPQPIDGSWHTIWVDTQFIVNNTLPKQPTNYW